MQDMWELVVDAFASPGLATDQKRGREDWHKGCVDSKKQNIVYELRAEYKIYKLQKCSF